jgi:hypothetical protein
MDEATSPSTVTVSYAGGTHRSKICSVCHCASENYHLNYGVSTCNSCRAFFRRSVQNSNFLDSDGEFVNYTCKTGGKCSVSADTRRSCRWCRFTACKVAGMDTKGVLKEKDKKIRFRKALDRHKGKQGSSDSAVQHKHRDGFAVLTFGGHTKCFQNAINRRSKQSNSDDVGTRNAVLSNGEPLKAGICSSPSSMLVDGRVKLYMDKSETKPESIYDKKEVKSSTISNNKTLKISDKRNLPNNKSLSDGGGCKTYKNEKEAVVKNSQMEVDSCSGNIRTNELKNTKNKGIDNDKLVLPTKTSPRIEKDKTENTINILSLNVNKVPPKLDAMNGLPKLVKIEAPIGEECKMEWISEQSLSESSLMDPDNALNETSNICLAEMLSMHFDGQTASETCSTIKTTAEKNICSSSSEKTNSVVHFFKKTSDSISSLPMGETHCVTQHDPMNIDNYVTPTSEDKNYWINRSSISTYMQTIPRCQRIRDQMNANLQHARQTWDLALNPIKLKTQFIHGLVTMHLGHSELLTKDLFWSHTTVLANMFQSHALQQPEFQSLSPNEQVRLLKKNAPTFVLYLLLGYMSATDGLSQMSWLLLSKVPDDVMKLRLMTVTPDRLNDVVGLFSQSNMDTLTNLTKDARLWRYDEVYLVSLACLFNDSSTEDSFEDLLTLSEWAHEVFWIGHRPDSIRHIIKVLEKAHLLLEGDITSDKDIYSPIRRRDVIETYTVEEELAMTAFFQKFDHAYGSLPLGALISKAWIDFASGIPLPRVIGWIGVKNVRERMHRLLFSICEDFSDLPFSSKTRAMTVNTSQAMVANRARIESYPSIKQQIGHFVKCGAMSEVCLPPCQDRKITMIGMNKTSALMNTDLSSRMQYLIDELKALVLDSGTYRLLLLVLLTNGLESLDGRKGIHQMWILVQF